MKSVANWRSWRDLLWPAGSFSVFVLLLLVSPFASAQCTDELPFQYVPIGATIVLPPIDDLDSRCGTHPGATFHYSSAEDYAAKILADIADTYDTDNTPCWPVGGSQGYFTAGLFYPAAGGAPMFYAVPILDAYSHKRETSTGLIVDADMSPGDAGYGLQITTQYAYADELSWQKVLNCQSDPEDGKNTGGQCPAVPAPRPMEGNPIGLGVANKYQAESDIRAVGPSRLGFTRYYNSRPVTRNAGIGMRWTHSYSASVWHFPPNNLAKVFRPDGRAYSYRQVGSEWIADPDVLGTLTPLLDGTDTLTGWRYRREDNVVEEFDAEGRLLRISYLGGYTIDVAYNADGEIDTVTDSFGERLRFAYDGYYRIDSLTRETGSVTQQYRYAYDTKRRLVRVTYPDETPTDPTDNPYREYLYEDAEFPYALTGIIDEAGNRLATYAYDAQGRAVLSTHAGDAGRVDIAYDQPGGAVTVDNPKGLVRSYTMGVEHGVVKPSGIARQ